MNARCLYLEIGQSTLQALLGEDGLELPLERDGQGSLSPAGREKLTRGLRDFLQRHGWRTGERAYCAIVARGISLRRLSLPPAPKEERERLLLLQIESEFPLPPDELAWGSQPLNLNSTDAPTDGRQLMLVAAAKKELIREYEEVLADCGVTAVITLAALARSRLCPQPDAMSAMLDIGRDRSELLGFENGAPASLRMLSWGGENITRAIAEARRISREEAEKIKLTLDHGPGLDGEMGTALNALAGSIRGSWNGRKLYLTGPGARQGDLAARLARSLGNGVECERLEPASGTGRSAAILGLKKTVETDGETGPLVLHSNGVKARVNAVRPAPWKWAAAAAALLVGSLLLPSVAALVQKPFLARKLKQLQADEARLPLIDRELGFLDYLKQSQPPYLDAVYVMANYAPPGTRFDSLTMNHQGEVSMRGRMQGLQAVTDFRTKLVASGFFANVVVEEQTPGQNQLVTLRISALWKSAREREGLKLEPPTTNSPSRGGAGGMVMPRGMMPGLPPGISIDFMDDGPPQIQAMPRGGRGVPVTDGLPPAGGRRGAAARGRGAMPPPGIDFPPDGGGGGTQE